MFGGEGDKAIIFFVYIAIYVKDWVYMRIENNGGMG